MKMAKKFMALALAVVLSVGCAFCVSADGSRTKNITVSQEQSKIYEVLQKIEETDGFKELKEEYPEIAEVLQKVGEGKMDMKARQTHEWLATANSIFFYFLGSVNYSV